MSELRKADARPLLQRQGGGDYVSELLLKQSRSRQWSRAGTLLETVSGRERGAAVRVVLPDGRSSLITTAAPDAAGLARDLERARLLACHSAPDPHLTLPGPAPQEDERPPADRAPDPELSGEAEARELLARMTRPAIPGIRVVRAWIRRAVMVTELANSTGFDGGFRSELTVFGVLLAVDDTEPLVHEELFAGGEAPDIVRFLETALDRARGLLGSRTGYDGSWGTLVLTPEAAAPLLTAIGSRFVPPADSRGGPGPPTRGSRVAGPGITLLDDGCHPGGLRSAPFDGEGTATGATVLMRDGIMENLVHDRRSASRAGTRSTGNAIRDSYRQPPAPGLTTLVLRPQPDRTEDDLLVDISRGLYAVEAAPPDPDRLEAGILSIRFRGRLISSGRLLSPAAPVLLRIPLDQLLPLLQAAAGRPRLIVLDGCVDTPLLRLDGVRLIPC